MKSTLDSAFKVVLGVELDSMSGTNEGALFTSAFDEASAITLYRHVDVFWKIRQFLNTGSEAKLKDCIQVVYRFVYKIIRSKIEQADSSQDGLQERIAREVWEATKARENSSFGELVASLSEAALKKKCSHLQAALTETLRLYPAVPVDGKLCSLNDLSPDGVSVRREDQVAYQPYAMGWMKWLWGGRCRGVQATEMAQRRRCLPARKLFQIYTAFQAGPRICWEKRLCIGR